MGNNQDQLAQQRKLKLYNGNGINFYEHEHSYICAKNVAHAVWLINEVYHGYTTKHEFNEYWSKDGWGTTMIGVDPRIGIWVQMKKTSEIVRVVGPWMVRLKTERSPRQAFDKFEEANDFVAHLVDSSDWGARELWEIYEWPSYKKK
jgi:hypothetical protein